MCGNMSEGNKPQQRQVNIFIVGLCILLVSVASVVGGESYALPADETYSSVSPSVDGMRRVIAGEGALSGFIDEEGTPITPMIFEVAWDFEKGRQSYANKADGSK
jgi:hypothetical protein